MSFNRSEPLYGLFIEDNEGEAYLMQEALHRKAPNFKFDFANSLQEAVELFDLSKHQVLVTDYNLPDGEGPEIGNLFLSKNPNIQIIVLSNVFTDKQIHDLKEVGVTQFFAKDVPDVSVDQILKFLA